MRELRGKTALVTGVASGIGRAITVPANARRVDGTGRYLIPGLADMHTHLFSDDELPDSLAGAELGVMIANGITTARLMIGTPEQLALRAAVARGRLLGPQLWVASPQLTGREFPNAIVVTTEEQARRARVGPDQREERHDPADEEVRGEAARLPAEAPAEAARRRGAAPRDPQERGDERAVLAPAHASRSPSKKARARARGSPSAVSDENTSSRLMPARPARSSSIVPSAAMRPSRRITIRSQIRWLPDPSARQRLQQCVDVC